MSYVLVAPILFYLFYRCSSGSYGQSRAGAGRACPLPVVVWLAGLRRITCSVIFTLGIFTCLLLRKVFYAVCFRLQCKFGIHSFVSFVKKIKLFKFAFQFIMHWKSNYILYFQKNTSIVQKNTINYNDKMIYFVWTQDLI